MKNTDKAIELSNKFKCITIGERCKNIEGACYKMAVWKEQQMIEKAVNWLLNNATDHIGFDSISESFSLSWDFIDLFKQAMKE